MIKLAIEEWGLYNAGYLACKWWTAEDDINDIREFYINARRSHDIQPYDDIELFNADYEAEYHGINFNELLSEDISFEDCIELHNKLDDLADYEIKKISFLTDCQGYSLEDAIDQIEDCTIYEDTSFTDLAYDMVEEGLFGDIPAHLANYIDYDAIARDLQYDYTEHNGDIFRCD